MAIPTQTVPERVQVPVTPFKALAKKIADTLRVGLPGVITAFDPVRQYASVQLAILENIVDMTKGVLPTQIPELHDVLVLFPGDASWCLTFPNLVGAECYVCFADCSISAWATNGLPTRQGIPQAQPQEHPWRHNLSDGFAILSPRSQPHCIQNFSTTNVELRSMDDSTKIALTNNGTVLLKGNALEIDGTVGVIHSGTTPSQYCIAVTINGVTWYVRLSPAP